jgi:hypothetical protein
MKMPPYQSTQFATDWEPVFQVDDDGSGFVVGGSVHDRFPFD